MANILSNQSLEEFIGQLNVSLEQKGILASKVAEMDKAERTEFLELLKDIYLLDLEKAEAVKKCKAYN